MKNILENYHLKDIFLTLFLLGSAIIILGIGYNLHFIITVIAPAAIIVVYFLIGQTRQKIGVSKEHFADSIYYLGFLFTLTSLGTSLFKVAGAYDLNSLVNAFSLALGTTILGLSLRLYVSNFGENDSSARAEAQREILDEVRLFSSHMRSATQIINQSNQASQTSIQLALTEIITEFKGAMSETVTNYKNSVNKSVTNLETPIKKLATMVNEYNNVLSTSLSDHAVITKLNKKTSASLENLNSKFENLEKSVDSASEQFNLIKDMEKSVESLTNVTLSVTESMQAIDKSTTCLASLNTQVSQLEPIIQH